MMEKSNIGNNKRKYFRKPSMLMLFVVAHLVHHLLTALQIPMLPFIRDEFGLDYTTAGFMISAFTLSYGISQIPAGRIADNLGRELLVAIGIVGVAISGFFIGISNDFISIIIFFVLMGITGGAYHPAALPLLTAAVKPEKQGQALGLHMIGGASSYFLAPLFAVAIATAFGWRSSFIWLSFPTIVFGIIFYRYLKQNKIKTEKIKTIPDSQTKITVNPGRVRRLTFFIILSSFAQAVSFAAIAFIPLYVVDHFGGSEKSAAVIISLFYSAGLWASFVGGYLSDRFGEIRVTLIVCFFTAPAIYFLNIVPYGLGFGALLVIIGGLNYMRFVITESYIINQTTDKNRSTIIGIFYFGSMEGGGAAAPLLGYSIDKIGFNMTFTFTAISILVITIICAMFLLKKN
jgi:predicted MFS family arabinose efflux permease